MSTCFETAIALIDEANAQDPNLIDTASGSRPAELVYGERMSTMLARVYPEATEELRLAIRAQHLKRWTRPRSDYPMDRKGYHAWRNAAKKAHAEDVSELLSRAGYDEDTISRVQSLIRKERVKRDKDAQAVEDIACLVFLEHYFSAFAAKHEHEKLIGILRKTWTKMSETAREAALKLPMDKSSSALVQEALSG
ncbi:MAG: DUF4202 domain-containing protein [Hyphomicrobiaceae bacterium]|nr:DUF4202 domain-containing protein [Hyphomicrobiaceae bacterium]